MHAWVSLFVDISWLRCLHLALHAEGRLIVQLLANTHILM
jgi:hypothetical protein